MKTSSAKASVPRRKVGVFSADSLVKSHPRALHGGEVVSTKVGVVGKNWDPNSNPEGWFLFGFILL
jgi:hypothetical protein